jgi:16S rRNA (cytidine1402-2'-O)-methyltransferase
LLNHYAISTRAVSYNEHNHARRCPELLDRLTAGADIALVSDAGTPAISDPGAALVAAAREAGHEVIAIPGPSAVAAAVALSGFEGSRFRFAGFLPRKAGELGTLLTTATDETLVAFESPERLLKTLGAISEALPDRRIAVCRELTKMHEEVFVGTAAEALMHFEHPRGEIVIVIEGGGLASAKRSPTADAEAEAREMQRLGLTRQQATPLLASRHGLGRREAYALWLRSEKR